MTLYIKISIGKGYKIKVFWEEKQTEKNSLF